MLAKISFKGINMKLKARSSSQKILLLILSYFYFSCSIAAVSSLPSEHNRGAG